MAPPRAKMYAKTGKHKSIDTSTSEPSSGAHSNMSSDPTSDAVERERQFELELCWCIQTMEASIDSNKLNAKQAQDTAKTIKILKSANQPLIKKRQVMRASFGDYRARMLTEERKLRLNTPAIQFQNEPSTTTNARSHFVKKSALLQTLGTKNAFKFGFQVANRPNDEKPLSSHNSHADNLSTEAASTATPSIPLEPSFGNGNDGFKFNFSIDTSHSDEH